MGEKQKKNRGVKVTLNCNGSNVGNGVGIGNGNFNGGGGSSECGGETGGYTGYTGYTGTTGGDQLICDSRCNLLCEQIYLEQLVSPHSVSRIGQELQFTFRVTNVSGKTITNPVVISSSLLGSIFVTDRGFDAGQTITINRNYLLKSKDLRQSTITSVAYAAYGIAIRPGGYNPGERISPIVVAIVKGRRRRR